MAISLYELPTAHGTIAVSDTGGPGQPLVLLHGSSASSAVFSRQLESPLANHFRLIAMDLPGHGHSSNFHNPDISYTLPIIAQTIARLFSPLGIDRAVVMGWSLGGHIAIEMMAKFPDLLTGVMISGTPPIDTGPLSTLRAFHLNPAVLLVSKPRLTHREAERLARLSFGDLAAPDQVQSILRTDPDIRSRVTRSLLRGDGADQRQTVETSPIPLAVVNGADDPAVRTSYLTGLSYANLWDHKVHLIAGGGHAPFMTTPNSFNALLHRFVTETAIGLPQPLQPAVAQRA
jgi:pimeloyl-ACP methyl ester carboxylesterase